MADEEFEEEDVWSFARERKEYVSPSSHKRAKAHSSSSSSSSTSKRPTSASRLIPKANNVNANIADQDNANEEDDDDGGDQVLPPHEWLAKKLARSRISSFSVCEGAGRTLKGRDQRNVRNAVLTRTGFLE